MFNQFISKYYTVEGVKVYLPIKMKGKIPYGAQMNLTLHNFNELTKNGNTVINSKKYKLGDYMTADLYELNSNASIYPIVCIDIDEAKGDSYEEQLKNALHDAPPVIGKLPYTLSRTKKLPHFYALIDINKEKLKSVGKLIDCFKDVKADLLFSHIWEKPDAEMHQYDGELPLIKYADIAPYLKEKEQAKLSENVELSPLVNVKFGLLKDAVNKASGTPAAFAA